MFVAVVAAAVVVHLTCSSSISGEGLGLNNAAHSSSKAKGLSLICQENALRMLYAAKASPAPFIDNSSINISNSSSSRRSSSDSCSDSSSDSNSSGNSSSNNNSGAAAAAAAADYKHEEQANNMHETNILDVKMHSNPELRQNSTSSGTCTQPQDHVCMFEATDKEQLLPCYYKLFTSYIYQSQCIY